MSDLPEIGTKFDEGMPEACERPDEDAVCGPKERLWSPTFLLISLCAFCAYVVAQGLNSGTTVYLDRIGFPAMYAGVVGAAFSVSAGIGRVLSGPLVDARGRMKVSIAGSCFLAIGTAIPLFLNDMLSLVLARIIQGVGFSTVATATATAAVDALPRSRLGEGVGYYGLAQSFAFAVGPASALFLVSLNPSSLMFAGMTLAAMSAALLSFLARYEKNPRNLPEKSTYVLRFQDGKVPYIKFREGSSGALGASEAGGNLRSEDEGSQPNGRCSHSGDKCSHKRPFIRRFLESSFDKRALPGAIPMFALSPVYGFAIFFMGLYGTSIGIEAPGLFFTVAAVTMIISRAMSGRFMNDADPLLVYAVAIACGILAYLVVAAAACWNPLYYVAGIPYGVSIGLALPILSAVAVSNTKAEHWGVANAMVGVAMDVGIGISIIIWGALSDSLGFTITMFLVIALFLFAFAVARNMFSRVGD